MFVHPGIGDRCQVGRLDNHLSHSSTDQTTLAETHAPLRQPFAVGPFPGSGRTPVAQVAALCDWDTEDAGNHAGYELRVSFRFVGHVISRTHSGRDHKADNRAPGSEHSVYKRFFTLLV